MVCIGCVGGWFDVLASKSSKVILNHPFCLENMSGNRIGVGISYFEWTVVPLCVHDVLYWCIHSHELHTGKLT